MMLTVALVGRPNTGKTTLFNALTGLQQKVANYAGVTVAKKSGALKGYPNIKIIDLPGINSLRPTGTEANITYNAITDTSVTALNLLVVVIDYAQLQLGLRLVLELQVTKIPLIVVISKTHNFTSCNIPLLAKLLNCSIIITDVRHAIGISQLTQHIVQVTTNMISTAPLPSGISQTQISPTNLTMLQQYHAQAKLITDQVLCVNATHKTFSYKLDKILLHQISGSLVLLCTLLGLFQVIFKYASIPQYYMQWAISALQQLILNAAPDSLAANLLANGIIAGAGATVVFLPQICLISLLMLILEESGYLARVALLMNNIMRVVGLDGRAFIPLLTSFSCAIPGILATRTIQEHKKRLITILIAPLITCSARIPVYTLMIAAFIPPLNILGIFNLQGLVMFALFAMGIIMALATALVFRVLLLKNIPAEPVLIELPQYQLPQLTTLAIGVFLTAKVFLARVTGIITAIMVIVWTLSTFPLPPDNSNTAAINYSMIAIIGKFIVPVFAPIGFSWQIVAALIPGFIAREVLVATLSTLFAIHNTSLSTVLNQTWSIATGLSLLSWYLFAPQCMATLAITKQETNSWLWPIFMFSYQLILAYCCAFIVYHLAV